MAETLCMEIVSILARCSSPWTVGNPFLLVTVMTPIVKMCTLIAEWGLLAWIPIFFGKSSCGLAKVTVVVGVLSAINTWVTVRPRVRTVGKYLKPIQVWQHGVITVTVTVITVTVISARVQWWWSLYRAGRSARVHQLR